MLGLLALNFSQKLGELGSKVNWSNPNWNLFILVLFFIFLFFFLILGKSRIIILTLSTYLTLAVINFLPLSGHKILKFSFTTHPFFVKVIIFWVFFLLINLLILNSVIYKFLHSFSRRIKLGKIIILNFFLVGFLVSINLSFLSLDKYSYFYPLVQKVFLSGIGKFFWAISPLIFLSLIRGRKKKEEKE